MLGLVLYKWALEIPFLFYSLTCITKNWWRWSIHVGKFRLWAVIKLWSNGGSGGAPWWTYWSAGITNTIGPAMGIEALKYISYPAQVLAKSSKMIPGEVSVLSITLDCSLFLSTKISLCILHNCFFLLSCSHADGLVSLWDKIQLAWVSLHLSCCGRSVHVCTS